jgi:hypothetical protein
VRLRIGVILWIVSWIPFAVIVGADGAARVAIWTIQVVVGVIGIAVAGSGFAVAVRSVGWRHAPGVAWRSLIGKDTTS